MEAKHYGVLMVAVLVFGGAGAAVVAKRGGFTRLSKPSVMASLPKNASRIQSEKAPAEAPVAVTQPPQQVPVRTAAEPSPATITPEVAAEMRSTIAPEPARVDESVVLKEKITALEKQLAEASKKASADDAAAKSKIAAVEAELNKAHNAVLQLSKTAVADMAAKAREMADARKSQSEPSDERLAQVRKHTITLVP